MACVCCRHGNYVSVVHSGRQKAECNQQRVQSTWEDVSNVQKSSSELLTTHQIKQKAKTNKTKTPLSTSRKQLPNNTELSTATHKNNLKYPKC